MTSVILVIHIFLALAIIGLVLLQRSEGGGLGIGGSGGGLGGLATPQGTANILTRATAICAAGFFMTSLVLGSIAGHRGHSDLMQAIDAPAAAAAPAPGAAPAEGKPPAAAADAPAPAPAAPEKTPSAPVSQ